MGARDEELKVGTLRSLTAEDVAKLATLSVVSRALHASSDLEEGLRSVLEPLMAALNADRGFIQIRNDDGTFAPEIALDRSVQPWQREFVYSSTLFHECVTEARPVLMLDAAGAGASSSVILKGIRSVMLYPIMNQEHLVGVLYMDSLVKAGQFRQHDLELLGIVADMVGVFLERARNALALLSQSKQLESTLGELREANRLLVDSSQETLYKLSRAAEFRDDEGGEHLQRVSHYCEAVALQMGFAPAIAARIRMASLLHDVGKVGIPDSILLKPGRYTEYEREVMKQHTIIGAKILTGSSSPVIRLAEEIAISHHEKWNGTGYPRALSADKIPLSGRIVAVADVFDALTTERRYKAAWTTERALELISQEAGSHFDPKICAAFLAIKDKIAEIRQRYQPVPVERDEEVETEAELVLKTRAEGRELLDPLRQAVESLARGSSFGHDTRGQALKIIRRLNGLMASLGLGMDAVRRLEGHFQKRDLAPEQAPRLAELLAEVEVSLSEEDGGRSDGRGVDVILLVDPDPHQRETLVMEGSKRGLTIVEAADVGAARRSIQIRPPQLVILEVAQPDADDFLNWLRQEHPDLPLVVLSSEGGFSRRLEVARRGGEVYLQKPLPASAVLEEISERIGREGDRTYRVLALDDDRVVLKVISRTLHNRGFEIQTLNDPLLLWSALAEGPPDILLLDLEMPTVNGLEVCRVLRSDPHRGHLPIIVLTGHDDQETYNRALEAGADDVLCKPLEPERMVSRIRSRLGRDVILRKSSGRDPRTGLTDIRAALRTANHLFAVAVRTGSPFSVCALKLEGFDEIMRVHGYPQATEVLRQMALVLERRARTEDIVAHYRDDCFLLCLYGSPADASRKFIDSINARLAQHNFASEKGKFEVKCSAFVACHPDDGTHLNELLEKVDAVLAPMGEPETPVPPSSEGV